MRWEDEKYVRIFIRDTADWLALSFDAQGLFTLLLRKVDRAGILPLGRHGKKAVAVVLGHVGLWDRLAPALDELLADGCVTLDGDRLIVPNFVAAQEATMSGALRTREWRERSKEPNGGGNSGNSDGSSQAGDVASRNVTSGDAARRGVTRRDSFLPSVPSEPSTTSSNALRAPVADDVMRLAEELAADIALPPPSLFPRSPAGAAAETTPPKAKRPPASKSETDARFAPLRAAWDAEYLAAYGTPYHWGGAADASGIHRVIAVDVEEFRERAKRGLKAQGYERCATLAELTSNAKWNRLAGTTTPARTATNLQAASKCNEFRKGAVDGF